LEEGLMLVGSGGAEAGADLIEVGVRIAGVTDEFPDVVLTGLRLGRENGAESGGDVFRSGGAGGEHSDSAGGRPEAGFADEALEGAMLGAEGDDGETA
jgi:hypothetical protein